MKIYNLIILLIIFVTPLTAQTKIISANGGALIPMGENTENYDIGYKAGLGLEFGIGKNFAIELEAGYSYLYCEVTDYKPFFGLWVDNSMPYFSLAPKIILPNNGNKFRFSVYPAINSSVVLTEATIYTLEYYGGTSFSENTTIEKDSNLAISLKIGSGLDFFITEKLGLGFNIEYQLVNLKDGSTNIPINKQGIDNNKVDTKGLNISAKLLLKI